MEYSKELHEKLRKRPAPWNEECIALLDEIERAHTEIKELYNAIHDIDNDRVRLQSVEKAQEWIPVEERLPEKDGLYQVERSEGKYDHLKFTTSERNLMRHDNVPANSFYDYSQNTGEAYPVIVIKWRPIPPTEETK